MFTINSAQFDYTQRHIEWKKYFPDFTTNKYLLGSGRYFERFDKNHKLAVKSKNQRLTLLIIRTQIQEGCF